MAIKFIEITPEAEDVYPQAEMYFVAGDTLEFELAIEDPDLDSVDPDHPTYIPRNLTGWSAAMQFRLAPDTTAILATWAMNVLDEDGVIAPSLSATLSQPLGVNKSMVFDLQLTSPTGKVDTIFGGPAYAVKDVTRV